MNWLKCDRDRKQIFSVFIPEALYGMTQSPYRIFRIDKRTGTVSIMSSRSTFVGDRAVPVCVCIDGASADGFAPKYVFIGKEICWFIGYVRL